MKGVSTVTPMYLMQSAIFLQPYILGFLYLVDRDAMAVLRLGRNQKLRKRIFPPRIY